MDQQTSQTYLSGEQPATYTPTGDERTMAIFPHVLTLVGSVIAPLIIYLIKKDESKYVSEHAKESMNFQITMIICYFISMVLLFIFIGILLMFAVMIFSVVMVIIASIKASENKIYRYPINFRLIK